MLIAQTGAYGAVMASRLQPARAGRRSGAAMSLARSASRAGAFAFVAARLCRRRRRDAGLRVRRRSRTGRAHRVSAMRRRMRTRARAAFDAALDLLHLVAGVSYYKAGVPAQDRASRAARSMPATADFLDALYLHGLGEFAYQNKLDLRGSHCVFSRQESAAVAQGRMREGARHLRSHLKIVTLFPHPALRATLYRREKSRSVSRAARWCRSAAARIRWSVSRC